MIFMRVDGFLTPKAEKVDVHLVHPGDRVIAMQPVDGGYFTAAVEEIASGALYLYCLEGQTERPDPASRFQSHAARGLSERLWSADRAGRRAAARRSAGVSHPSCPVYVAPSDCGSRGQA